ncbi:MAG TPA: ATP-dependent Clp protease ATP-binding subunit [Spirochaetota bacterium]|nr:ATP-dependent Clp protease ATP-binding subunit [Spirochaetota bacterium]HPJ37423.1 ATP-dependent Clp protease ATP-binding subunit [Spirochaetota bacterium]
MEMFDFTKRSRKVLEVYAQSEGRRLGSDSLGPEHVMLALLKDEDSVAARILKILKINFDLLRRNIEVAVRKSGSTIILGNVPINARFSRIIDLAKEEARKLKNGYIGTEHLLMALFMDGTCVGLDALIANGIDYNTVRNEVLKILGVKSQPLYSGKASDKTKTPSLEEFAQDLTQLSRDGRIDPVIGRQNEIERVIRILTRKTKNNPILIGEAGVGKTAIVEGLAQRICEKQVPESLQNMRVMVLDIASVVAGTKYRGEFEDRLKRIMKEIKSSDDVILFIDELHTIIGAGAAEGAIDAANMLKPSLARGELQCIGATTLNEYRMYIEKDSALERRFQHVLVDEPTVEETIDILQGIHSRYEAFHKVKYTGEALERAVFLSDKYIHDRFLPDKAIDIIDEAGSKARYDNCDKPEDIDSLEKEIGLLNERKNDLVKMQEYEQAAAIRDLINEKKTLLTAKINDWQQKINDYEIVVDVDQVALIVSQWTGIPVEKMEESESAKLLRMEEELHERIIGQDEAISSISRAIRRSRTGLKSANRPIGSFIFLGPTGVGKTELAKALAEFMFDDDTALIRLDMSEYMEKHSVSKIIGSPPGYIGYDEGGQLTEKVKRKPYSVILFDEIEKAHPDIFNILLQIFEEGELTDNAGTVVSFRDAVIIMTSNVGNRDFQHRSKMGFLESDDFSLAEREKVLDELRKLFTPEFINRLDEVVYFHKLNRDHIKKIVDLMLDEVNEKLEDRSLELEFSKSVRKYLSDYGFDEKYGARFLRRTIQNEIEDALATEVLKGNFENCRKLFVGLKSKKIYFKTLEMHDDVNEDSGGPEGVEEKEKVDIT